MKRICYLTLLSFLLPLVVFAGVLKGKITDLKGEALPFATVYVYGTTIGTSANAQGDYQLTLPSGSYKIACQYIGFKQSSTTITIGETEVLQHNFSLEDQGLQMKEHVVKASEDPAVYIMRKAIGKRKFHADQINAFQTGIYLKAVLKTREAPDKILGQKVQKEEVGLDSNGKGIVMLFEQIATYYRQHGKERTVIHSVRESGDPNGMGVPQFPDVIGFYENNVHISSQLNPRGFISPLNDFAFNFYKFKLLGDFTEGGKTIYKIKVTPRRLYEPLFNGDIYIVDEDWSIHSLDLTTTKKSSMELLDTLRIAQVYLPLKPDLWVIKQQVLYPALKIFGFDFGGSFVTVYNNQKVNEPAPDSIFNKKVISEYDAGANKKDTTYWAAARPVPLLDDEHNDYFEKDSLRLKFEDPKYKDSMRRRANRFKPGSLLLNGYSFNGRNDKFHLRTNALLTGLVNYNTIEGVNVAPKFFTRFKIDSTHSLQGVFALRYGFENAHFNAMGRINYINQKKDWVGKYWSVGVEAGKYVFQFNPNNPLDALYNTISTLFYRRNYLKLYERWNGYLHCAKNHGTGFWWNAKVGFQQRIPLTNTTNFSFAKETAGGFTENMPPEFKAYKWEQHNAVTAKLSLSYQPGYTYVKYPEYMQPNRSRLPTFTLSYEKGMPNLLDSKVDFDKWRFAVRDDVGLKMLGTFAYNIGTGGFLNTRYVNIPDLNHINGNQLTLASPYLESFQLAPYYTYSNSAALYGEAHVEWYLKGFLTNKIPLLRQLRWYLVTGANAYYVSENLYHTEAFVGIDNVGYEKFRIFRIDFVQSWNSFNLPASAIRIGLSTGSIIKVILGDRIGEW
ncbi:MAG TPA: DUF5686 and carboxypeptidase regulatory-like domain-containing protein [Flavipsychrobacter sp.]|nr:DUF5686 and carboxypeptidase regulatory-like domain-containing protein [Flavipsychrobacter sp.]